MSDTYELDATTDPSEEATPDGEATGESLGLSIPDEHVAAFVAEVFEDAERSTTWAGVVDELVAPAARDAWDALGPAEQVQEVLQMADEYDERACDLLEDIPLEADAAESEVQPPFREAMRYRRNADGFRNGVADAYADGLLADEAFVAAVEDYGFDTDGIARREDLLESVANVHDVTFRPYGGTLMDTEEGDDPDEFEAW
jgi:hypothetical protein